MGPMRVDCDASQATQETANGRLVSSFIRGNGCSIFVGRESYGGEPLMCFLPKRRASSDQAPGPIIARLAPMAAKKSETQESPPPEKQIQNSTMTTATPVTGVHNPMSSSTPAPAPIT